MSAIGGRELQAIDEVLNWFMKPIGTRVSVVATNPARPQALEISRQIKFAKFDTPAVGAATSTKKVHGYASTGISALTGEKDQQVGDRWLNAMKAGSAGGIKTQEQ